MQKKNKISLAFLDIELGKTNGLDLCKKFLEINPRTNIIFLTAYVEYSFEAWSTGASGYFIYKNLNYSTLPKSYPLPANSKFRILIIGGVSLPDWKMLSLPTLLII